MRILSLILFLAIINVQAQNRCATEKFDSLRRNRNPLLESPEQFEKWINFRLKNTGNSVSRTQSNYVIPVVIHIIHHGEAIGSGTNLSDAQIISQINVLNKDFQRLNTDASQTPSDFTSVAGSLNIQFVLAKQDPQGNATSGINRVNGGKTAWYLYQDTELKGLSYWPAEQYFNVWVTNFPDYLGYTQFPVSNQVAGLDNSSLDRLTDGIIIHYRSFGSIDDGAFDLESQYNKGRSLTHETGHFFGLRHIWGDGSSCSATDYVNDTPPQIGSTLHCPTHPVIECSNQAKMFQNYMDYTDDPCMNLFTMGQVDRMKVVLANSPRRASLTTSPGSQPPGNFNLDLGIVSVSEPTTLECSGIHTPSINIKNFGLTSVTQASIELKINGNVVQTITPTLSLNTLQETSVTFNNYTSSSGDVKQFDFTIKSVNGSPDEYVGNDIFTLTVNTAHQASLPYLENFEAGISNWNVLNPDGLTSISQTSLSSSQGNAIFLDSYDYEDEGAVDKIFSPVINVSGAPGLLLKFKLAYAQFPGIDGDALSVFALPDCSEDLSLGTLVFHKEASALSTTTSTSGFFSPTPSQWETQFVAIGGFQAATQLRLAFVFRNGYGNNIYIDDVQVIGQMVADLGITDIAEPSSTVCLDHANFKLTIANSGNVDITGFKVVGALSKSLISSQVFSETINTGTEVQVIFNSILINDGVNDFSFEVTPTNLTDDIPTNNIVNYPVLKVSNETRIPARENFNTSSTWQVLSTGNSEWHTTNTNFGKSMVFNAYGNSETDARSILVSPQLDFTQALEASLFADFSYSLLSPTNDVVKISLSDDCGNTFDNVLFEGNASELHTAMNNTDWLPSTANDWTRLYRNLDNYAGKKNILITIEAQNKGGNNLYVDNIEFFVDDNANPVAVKTPFSIYYDHGEAKVTFNLDEPQPVRMQFSTVMGQALADEIKDYTLNQTYSVQINSTAPSVYLTRITIGNKVYNKRLILGD